MVAINSSIFTKIRFRVFYSIYTAGIYLISFIQISLGTLSAILGRLLLLNLRAKKAKDKPLKIAIVGAGIRGLCSAVWLKNQGCDVTVYELEEDLGGTWRTVAYHQSTLQMPSVAYTFHWSNHWPNSRATAADIIRNLKTMCQLEGLTNHIHYGEKITSISRDTNHKFHLNGQTEESFDGILICTGHLSKHMDTNYRGIEKFKDKIVYPYNYNPENTHLPGSVPLVVGGGASAMEHVKYAIDGGCEKVYWLIRHPRILQIDEVTKPRRLQDLMEFSPLWMTLVPWLIKWVEWPFKYRSIYKEHSMDDLFPVVWERPALPQFNIYKEIKNGRVQPVLGEIVEVGGNTVTIDKNNSQSHVKVDVIVNCTGFRYKTPAFINRGLQEDGTVLITDCPANVTFTSYGLGNSTMHAKLLYMHLLDPTTRPKNKELLELNLLVPRDCWQQRKQRMLHLCFYFTRYLLSQKSRIKWLFIFSSQTYSSVSKVKCFSRLTKLWAPVFAPFGL